MDMGVLPFASLVKGHESCHVVSMRLNQSPSEDRKTTLWHHLFLLYVIIFIRVSLTPPASVPRREENFSGDLNGKFDQVPGTPYIILYLQYLQYILTIEYITLFYTFYTFPLLNI